jgi:hypothetical protein
LLKKHKAGTCGKAAYFICNLPETEAAKMIEILKPNKKKPRMAELFRTA